jgi:hypothetical protein
MPNWIRDAGWTIQDAEDSAMAPIEIVNSKYSIETSIPQNQT